MDIIKQLNALGETVGKNIHDLNAGGCGVFASMVAKTLNSKGIPASCFACYSPERGDEGGNVDEARLMVNDVGDSEEWEDNGIHFYHVGVEFKHRGKRYFYDSRGVTAPSDEFYGVLVHEGRLSTEEMEALAERPHNWNFWFDRRQIPKLQSYVEEYLNG